MAYLYFSTLNTKANQNDLSLNAASTNAAFVFSFDNEKKFFEILSGQDLFERILGKQKSAQLKAIGDNLAQNTKVNHNFGKQKIYISFVAGPNNEIDFLISSQVNTKTDLQQTIKNLSTEIKITQHGKLYQLNFNDTTSCSLTIKDNLVLISNSEKPIKNVILTKQKLNADFANYIKTNSLNNKNTLAHLFINFNNVPPLLKNILSTNIGEELSMLNKQNAFAVLNYNFSKDKLLFTGNTEINEANYYNLFSKINEQKIFINTILPSQTANYSLFAIDNYQSWRKALDKLRGIETPEIEKKLRKLKQQYGIDLTKLFNTYFKNQLITFQLQSGEKLGAFALTNGEKVNQLLLDLSTEYDDSIRHFKENDVPYYFFGKPFKKFKTPFYTIIDNYLIIANNASTLTVFLNAYQNNSLLVNDENYINLRDQLSPSATICFYVNNKNSNNLFSRNLKTVYFNHYQSTLGFKNFNSFCYQLSGKEGKFLTNLLLHNFLEKTINPDSLVLNRH